MTSFFNGGTTEMTKMTETIETTDTTGINRKGGPWPQTKGSGFSTLLLSALRYERKC